MTDGNEIKKCPFCAETTQAQSLKCEHCGSDLAPQPQTNPDKKVCPFCAELIATTSVFCPHCGSKLNASEKQAVGENGSATSNLNEASRAPGVGLAAGAGASVIGLGCMVPLGILLCCTVIGAIIGIPLILAGLGTPALGPIAAMGALRGQCPYCGKKIVVLPLPGKKTFTALTGKIMNMDMPVKADAHCPICRKGLTINGKQFFKMD